MSVKLLGENLVLARLDGEMFAGDDRCIHRSAQLSLGQVCKHQGKDTLQCPYHGWRYNDEGKCALIPACPDMPIPSKAKIFKTMIVRFAMALSGFAWITPLTAPRFLS